MSTTTQRRPISSLFFGRSYGARYTRNLIVAAIGTFIVAVAVLGRNAITGDISLNTGFQKMGAILSGIMSFKSLMIVGLALTLVLWLLWYMTEHNFTGERPKQIALICLAVFVFALGAIVGVKSIHAPSGTRWMVIGYVALASIMAFLSTEK